VVSRVHLRCDGTVFRDASILETGTTMALEQELATYQTKLPELKQHDGKFVLIHGDEVCDIFFSTYEDALQVGYKRYGLKPFLVKQIQAVEPIFYFTRPIGPVQRVS